MLRCKEKFLVTWCLGVAVCVSTAAVVADTHPAEAVVRATSEKVVAEIHSHGDQLLADRARLYQLIERTIVPHFDLKRMAQYVVGKHWRRATDAQRQAFATEFKTLLVRTYGGALTSFPDFDVVHLPLRPGNKPHKATARMEIRLANGNTIPVDYRMHGKDGDWKVYDIVVDGVSLISTYRSSFSSYISRSGLDGLISEIKARNSQSVAVSDS